MLNKILVVDDEEQVRATVRRQLKGTGLVVLEAEDGEKAIELLRDENVLEVDTIICDVRMPNINGVEAVAYLRREYPLHPSHCIDGLSGREACRGFHEGGRDRLPRETRGKRGAD